VPGTTGNFSKPKWEKEKGKTPIESPGKSPTTKEVGGNNKKPKQMPIEWEKRNKTNIPDYPMCLIMGWLIYQKAPIKRKYYKTIGNT